jgi:hypothetical protein
MHTNMTRALYNQIRKGNHFVTITMMPCSDTRTQSQLLGSMGSMVGMVNKDGKKASECTTDKSLLEIFAKFAK